MEKQLTLLEHHQDLLKRTLYQKKNKLLSTLYNDVIENKPIKKTKKDLAIIGVGSGALLVLAMSCVRHATKVGSQELLKYVMDINNEAIKIINNELRKSENEQKIEIIKDTFRDNRKDKKLIYICSRHDDSASDHRDWQGKFYIDRYWYAVDKSKELKNWVRTNSVKTIQWVMGNPVYMFTRPYCRHYFVAYTVQDILSGKYTIPSRATGQRGLMQTAKPHTPLSFYKDRLRLLYSLQDNPTTRNAINKTKLLIMKWEKKQ